MRKCRRQGAARLTCSPSPPAHLPQEGTLHTRSATLHTPHPPHPHPNPTTPPPSSYPFTQGKPNTHTVCCTSTPVYKLHTAHCTYNTSLAAPFRSGQVNTGWFAQTQNFKSINQESTKRTNPILCLEPPSETPYFTLCRESATYVSGLVHN